MLFTRPGRLLMVLACALAAGQAVAQTPAERSPREALHALQTATDPQTVAARRQIESGPALLEQARAAAKAAGIPLDPARLQRRLVAPALDAAPLYVRLGALREQQQAHQLDSRLLPPSPRYRYSPKQLGTVRRYLRQHSGWLALAHQAASRPFCVFRRDWSRGPEILFSEYQYQGAAVQLLQTEAYFLVRDGHPDAAIQNAVRVLHIAEQIAADPTINAYLGSWGFEENSLRILSDVLAVSPPSPRLARQVTAILENNLPHRSLWYATAGEGSLWLITLNAIRRPPDAQWGWGVTDGGLTDTTGAGPDYPVVLLSPIEEKLVIGIWDAWEIQALTDLTRQTRLLRAGTPAQDIVQEPTSAAYRWAAQVLRLTDSSRNPTLDMLKFSLKRPQARENVLRTAAALLADPARPPQRLPDPFSGRPLGFRREGRHGFVVYSVGENGTDRGVFPEEREWANADPILFRFPAPRPVTMPLYWAGD